MDNKITREQFLVQYLLDEIAELKIRYYNLEYDYKLLAQENRELKAEVEECGDQD